MCWYKQLVAQKFDGSQKRTKLGRSRVSDAIEALVLQMANDNPTWGYRCIQGALANLGYRVDKITVRNILRRYHIDPAPKRRQSGMNWSQFLKLDWEVLATTDFFTVEVATLAWARDLLCPGGDGAEHATSGDCRYHPTSQCRLHATMRPAAHQSLRWLSFGQTLSHP